MAGDFPYINFLPAQMESKIIASKLCYSKIVQASEAIALSLPK